MNFLFIDSLISGLLGIYSHKITEGMNIKLTREDYRCYYSCLDDVSNNDIIMEDTVGCIIKIMIDKD